MSPQLSHRERVNLAMEHQPADRVPIAMVCSGINLPAYSALTEYLQQERHTTVEQYLRPLIDIADVGPAYVGPELPTGTDVWGVCREPVSYGEGSYDEISHYPLAKVEDPADLAGHRWPTTDWFDYSELADHIRAADAVDGEMCILVSGGNPFETAWYMRGFERLFADLVLAPELARKLLERVCSFYERHLDLTLTAAEGRVDLVFTADDIGGQDGLLMSLDMWADFIKPYHVRLNRIAHNHGARVIYHSDGGVAEAVPGLIDMGIDVLQALQFDAKGMDPEDLKRRFGGRLGFEGGVSVQSTLPFGTPEDVRREVRDRVRVLGTGGGYILGPSHAIQAGTPPENVVAMFDTAAVCPV